MSKDLNRTSGDDDDQSTVAVAISGFKEEEAEQDDDEEEEEEDDDEVDDVRLSGTIHRGGDQEEVTIEEDEDDEDDSLSLLPPDLYESSRETIAEDSANIADIRHSPTLHRYQVSRKRPRSISKRHSSSSSNYRRPNNSSSSTSRGRLKSSNIHHRIGLNSRSSSSLTVPRTFLSAFVAPFIKPVLRLFGGGGGGGGSGAGSSRIARLNPNNHSRDIFDKQQQQQQQQNPNLNNNSNNSSNSQSVNQRHLGASIESLISLNESNSSSSSRSTSPASFGLSSKGSGRLLAWRLLARCFQPQNFRLVHLLLIVFFFLFFVIQFKSGPLSSTFGSAPFGGGGGGGAGGGVLQLALSSPSPTSHLSKLLLQHRLQTQSRNDQSEHSDRSSPRPPPAPSIVANSSSLATNNSSIKVTISTESNSTSLNLITSITTSSFDSDSDQSDNKNNTAAATDNTAETESGAAIAANLNQTETLKPCPLVPPNLVGQLKVLTTVPSMEKLEQMLPDVELGGRYQPHHCRTRHRVAIVIPYRDRPDHLLTFLLNLHPMLMRQNIDYGIYVVEQSGKDRFNRAKLMNVGFLEAMKQYQYDCFIFHDIDLIPEDDRNLYTCPEQPRHMSVAVDKFHYRLPYKDIFGGVSALTRQQFEHVNGFSNEFWGWGGEDDDMSNRIRHYGYTISRYPPQVARYKMLKHMQDQPNADRYKKLYNGWRRYKSDGINSTKYQLIDITFKKLYTWILVDLFPPKFPPVRSKKRRRTRF